MDASELEWISKNLAGGEVREHLVLSAHITQVVFAVIDKEIPKYFYFSDSGISKGNPDVPGNDLDLSKEDD